MSNENFTQSIPIGALEPGMFVVKLDIPWLDSPFIKNTRLIKSKGDIDKLYKAGVKTVVIDISKGKIPGEATAKKVNTDSPSLRPSALEENPLPEKPTTNRVSIHTELQAAKNIRNKLSHTIEQLNAQLEKNLPINTETVSPLIDQTIESLERNNQALLSLSHISRKSKKLADHCFSTFCLALSIERTVRLSDKERNALGVAALLHESGWLNLPLQLMGKRNKYTASEQKLIQTHPQTGVDILKRSTLPELSLRIICEHHEKPNGSGYPNKLTDEQIHTASKILAVADTYDEYVHQLADKPGMLPTNALKILYKDAEQNSLDIHCVSALISVLGIYPVSSAVILNTGERAIVEDVLPSGHLTPIIVVHYDKHMQPLDSPLRINLQAQSPNVPERKIVSVFDPNSPQNDPLRRMAVFSE